MPLPQDVLAHLLVTGSATCTTNVPCLTRTIPCGAKQHNPYGAVWRQQDPDTTNWLLDCSAQRVKLSPKVRMTLCGVQPNAPAAAACLRLTHLHESYSPDRHSRGHAGCAAGHLTSCHNSHVQNRIALDHQHLYVSGRGVRACCLRHQRSVQTCRSMWQHVIHRKAVQAARRTQAPFCAPCHTLTPSLQQPAYSARRPSGGTQPHATPVGPHTQNDKHSHPVIRSTTHPPPPKHTKHATWLAGL